MYWPADSPSLEAHQGRDGGSAGPGALDRPRIPTGGAGRDDDDFNEFLDDAEVNDSEDLLDQADEAEAASR